MTHKRNQWMTGPSAEGHAVQGLAPATGTGRAVSLIPSLIHVRVPGSMTVYYRALSRSIDLHGRSWTVILNTEKRKVGAAPHGAVGPASAAGLTLAARPPHAGPLGQAPMSDRPQATPILLTRLLTTNLDERGQGWNCPVATGRASGRYGQRRPDLDEPDLATDQKVGGSSPSERAHGTPGQHDRHVVSGLPTSSSGRILGRITIRDCLVEPVGVAVHLSRVQVPVQVEGRGDAGMAHDLLEHLRRVARLDHQRRGGVP